MNKRLYQLTFGPGIFRDVSNKVSAELTLLQDDGNEIKDVQYFHSGPSYHAIILYTFEDPDTN